MATILVVDDNGSTREFLGAILRQANHAVVEAVDGDDALRRLRTEAFDLVLTDILMPGRDGLELIQMIRRDTPALKVIAYTGGGEYLGVETLEAAQDFGAGATLTKPVEMDQLLKTVNEVLKGHHEKP